MAEQTLTEDDLQRYSAALAEGKKPTVYLIEPVPSLGLAGGASARVVEVAGTTVTVKPAGVDDHLPYEARELRATKVAKPRTRPAKKSTATAGRAPAQRAARPTVKAPEAAPSGAARRAPSAVAITVYVGADNAAAITVTENPRKPAGLREVPLASVQKALAALDDAQARSAVDDVLAAARDAAADKVAALQAELSAAKKSLASLERAKRGTAQGNRTR